MTGSCDTIRSSNFLLEPRGFGELGTAGEAFSAAVDFWGGPQQRFPEKESRVSLELHSK